IAPGPPAGHRVRPTASLRYGVTAEGASRDRGVRAVSAEHPRRVRVGQQRLMQPRLATPARSTPADDEEVERPADLAERQVPLRNGHVIYPDWKGASVWAKPLYQRV